jgi:hypothetical protein
VRRISTGQGGAWVDHVWYPDITSAAYLVAKAVEDERRRAQRARLLALIEAERDQDVDNFSSDQSEI